MSMSDTTENDVLEMICKGTDPAWRAGATGYWALFTADPGESGSLAAGDSGIRSVQTVTISAASQVRVLWFSPVRCSPCR